MKSDPILQRLLSEVPLFHEFNEHELALFLSYCKQKRVPPQTTIIHQGEFGRHLFAVMQGSLRVSHMRDNVLSDIAVLRTGDVFGELALVDYGERSASVVSLEPCRLMLFDRADLLRLPEPLATKLYRNVGSLMAVRLRKTNALVSVLLAELREHDGSLAASLPLLDA